MAITDESNYADGAKVLPFYIVCDESASMDQNGGIDAINESLPDLHATITADPLVNDKTRIALVSFSSEAQVLVPLCAAADVDEMPGVTATGSTKYGAVFELLKRVITDDGRMLRSDGFQVIRPTVFFVSDGEPTDEGDWETPHAELTDKNSNPWAANIIAFGVDSADRNTIFRVATLKGGAFESSKGSAPAAALKKMIPAITKSIIKSGSQSVPQLVLPKEGDGFNVIDLDVIDEG